jgi:hypothetical protein
MRRVVEVGWEAGAGDVQLVYRDEYERRLHALHASDELLDRTTAWLETAILSMEGQRWSSYSATRTPTLPRCRSGTGGSCRTATRSRDRPRSDVPSRDRLEHHRRPHRGLGQRRARAAGSGAALAGKWRPSRDSTSRTRSRRGGSASPRSTHAAPRCTPRRSTGFTSPAPERISRSGCCRRPLGRRRRDDVLGPDLRRQPADGGSLHDPGPAADGGNRAHDEAAPLVRLGRRRDRASLRGRQSRRGPRRPRRGLPPLEAGDRRRGLVPRRGRARRRNLPRNAICSSRTGCSTRTPSATSLSAAATRSPSRVPRSCRTRSARRPGSTSPRSTLT